MALLGAKRLHQHAAIYTPEMAAAETAASDREPVDELRRQAGSQFDAGVVDALCRVLERTGEPELLAG